MESIEHIRRRSGRGRSLLIFSLFTAISSTMAATVGAQTLAEWFEQNKTQKKYLLQQIAALEVFSGYLKEGYHIASKGLGSISGSLKAENSLHAIYYNRLNIVDSAIKNNSMVKEIMTLQQDILVQLAGIDQIAGITAGEKNYLNSVRTAVLKDCDNQISTLQNVITDGRLEMSDAERMMQITKVRAVMLDNYRFVSGFITRAEILAARRRQLQSDVAVGKQLYGIN